MNRKERRDLLYNDCFKRGAEKLTEEMLIYFRRIAEIISEIEFEKCYTIYDIDSTGFDYFTVHCFLPNKIELMILIYPHDGEHSNIASLYLFDDQNVIIKITNGCQILNIPQHFKDIMLEILKEND